MAGEFKRFMKNALGHEIGSGNVVSEQRDVGDFNEVTLSGVGQLSITQTGSESLAIEAEDNILPLLTSEVRDHRLILGTEPGTHFTPKRTIRYTLTVKDLSAVRISGAGNVEIPALGTPSLRLEISGAGNMTITGLAAEKLEVTLSGAGNATCAGEAHDQDVRISGAGSYHADDLATTTARATISGTGSAHLRVSEQLDARVSGVGSITYRGQPTVRKSVSGIGRVSQQS
ncbi:MAG TPA: head GIN domain-containing protein [Ktedonobacterales bacterium]|nr:head GIN domain-containing protein [Ktedonobacterales bacterium]